jgi:hypothetical protein
VQNKSSLSVSCPAPAVNNHTIIVIVVISELGWFENRKAFLCLLAQVVPLKSCVAWSQHLWGLHALPHCRTAGWLFDFQ